MTDQQDKEALLAQISKDIKRGKLTPVNVTYGEGLEEGFLLQSLSGPEAGIVVARTMSLLAPILAKVQDDEGEYQKEWLHYQASFLDEEALPVDEPIRKWTGLAFIVGSQMNTPEFQDLCYDLLEGLLNSEGELVDIRDDFYKERQEIYFKLLQEAIMENLAGPLMHALGGVVSVQISSFLREQLSTIGARISDMLSENQTPSSEPNPQ